MVKDILNWLNNNLDKKVYWKPTNPVVKSDGVTSFPLKSLALNYTYVYEILDKLCSDEFTEDGTYCYYLEPVVSGSNYYYYFVVKAKRDTPASYTLSEETNAGTITEGINSFDQEISINKEDVVNWVVYNCGYDLYGDIVENFEFDAISIAKFGIKTDYPTDLTQNIFTNLWNNERYNSINASYFFEWNSYNVPTLSFPKSYPFTFTDGTVVNSDKDFNDYLRNLSLRQGRLIAKKRITDSANPKYSLKYNQRFENKFNPTDVWICNFGSRNLESVPLRVEDISLSVKSVSVSLVQDEKNSASNIK